jgi:hypothetical protein
VTEFFLDTLDSPCSMAAILLSHLVHSMKIVALFLTALSAGPAAAAAFSYTSGPYQQDFNSLASTGLDITWTDEVTLPGWTEYSAETGYTGSGAFTFTVGVPNAIADAYDADTGGSATGEVYSYGSAAVPADRALGSLASGTPDEMFHVLHITNDTGMAGAGFTLQYTGEQWRRGGTNTPQRPESLLFYFRVGGTAFDDTGTWIEVTPLHFTSPNVATTTASLLDGNDPANRITLADTVTASFAAGEHLWFAWVDPDNTGTDHGLAIDDLELTLIPVPEPSVAALTAGAALLWLRRRRA